MFCPRCGRALPDGATTCQCGHTAAPAPAAAAPPAPQGMSKGAKIGVGIAIGCVVLFFMTIVLGILAAIAIPNLLNAIDRGKQKRTMADMRTIGTALEMYAVEHNAYPVATTLEELRPLLEPKMVDHLPMQDGWQRPIEIVSTAQGYRLVSVGKDGQPDGCPGGPTNTFNADICFENGAFTQVPMGLFEEPPRP